MRIVALYGTESGRAEDVARGVDGLLASLGARPVGTFGEHDEISRQDHVAVGVAWAREVLAGRAP